MNKITRKLLISVFTLGFALVTLGATTFAWFTLSTTADIDPINVQVTAGKGIELSANGSTYKNNIDLSDITTQIGGSLPIFDAVTTADGTTFTNIKGEGEAANGKYLEFKLWVRSPSKDGLVYLLEDGELGAGTHIDSVAKTWKPDTVFTYTEYGVISTSTPIDVYGANSLRFSLEEQNHLFDAKKTDGLLNVFELDPKTADAANKNTKLGTQVDNTQGLVSYWSNKLGEDITSGKTINLPETVYSNSDLGLNASEQPKQSIAKLDYFEDSSAGEGDPTGLSIDGFYYGHLKVRIWLEGWDPDSFDAILGTPITVVLKFGVA